MKINDIVFSKVHNGFYVIHETPVKLDDIDNDKIALLYDPDDGLSWYSYTKELVLVEIDTPKTRLAIQLKYG